MQVQTKIPEPTTVQFHTITYGTPFKYQGMIMMGVKPLTTCGHNAVSLSSGHLTYLGFDARVEPLQAKVVVEA